tara:strand:- start:766 stop:996 length:231 start_codon:yes stop_codon:yes gene_type:complete
MVANENNKRSMRTEIIEILQSKYPEYCMQHIDTADEILRLFSVVVPKGTLCEPHGCLDYSQGYDRCEKQCDRCKDL